MTNHFPNVLAFILRIAALVESPKAVPEAAAAVVVATKVVAVVRDTLSDADEDADPALALVVEAEAGVPELARAVVDIEDEISVVAGIVETMVEAVERDDDTDGEAVIVDVEAEPPVIVNSGLAFPESPKTAGSNSRSGLGN